MNAGYVLVVKKTVNCPACRMYNKREAKLLTLLPDNVTYTTVVHGDPEESKRRIQFMISRGSSFIPAFILISEINWKAYLNYEIDEEDIDVDTVSFGKADDFNGYSTPVIAKWVSDNVQRLERAHVLKKAAASAVHRRRKVRFQDEDGNDDREEGTTSRDDDQMDGNYTLNRMLFVDMTFPDITRPLPEGMSFDRQELRGFEFSPYNLDMLTECKKKKRKWHALRTSFN